MDGNVDFFLFANRFIIIIIIPHFFFYIGWAEPSIMHLLAKIKYPLLLKLVRSIATGMGSEYGRLFAYWFKYIMDLLIDSISELRIKVAGSRAR